ncbi:MAG: hypothetical protein ACOYUZ_05615 [Patescibacteria group bacterium]
MQAISQKELEQKIQLAKSWSSMRVDEGSFLLLQILTLFVILSVSVLLLAFGIATFNFSSLWINIALFAAIAAACRFSWRRYKRALHLYDRADQITQAWKNYLDYHDYLASLAKPTDSQTASLQQAGIELYWAAASFDQAAANYEDCKKSPASALPAYRVPALPAFDVPLEAITPDDIPESCKRRKTLIGEIAAINNSDEHGELADASLDTKEPQKTPNS